MVKRRVIQKESSEQSDTNFDKCCDDLKLGNHSDKEIKSRTSPHKQKINFLNFFDYLFLITVLLVILIQLLKYSDFFSWQLSSLGRILMIRFLPVYDWRHLKNKQCIIDKNHGNSNIGSIFFNCDLCENIKKIEVHDTLDENLLEEKYIELDVPIIITKGMEFWPKSSKFLEDLTLDKTFSTSYPCKFASSSFKGQATIGEVFKRLQRFDQFFVHFQNCEQDAMRILREFTFRPNVLPARYSPVTYNWLIWNKNYNTTGYKTVDLIEKLTIYGQIAGSSYVRLIPRNNCENACSILKTKLIAGEMLIFTSLWDLEYKPNEIGENIAVILEVRD